MGQPDRLVTVSTRARLRAVKGTRDLFPPESEIFAAVEETARRVFRSYGYGEVRTPILEHTELFARSVGETTDIVHKEMYTFADRKGRSLTLRPENTAGVVRALIEWGLERAVLPLRLWYAGEQFRYERPQKARYREFRQIGAELLGVPGPAADAELLTMLFDFLRALEFGELSVRLNCIGTGPAREAFAAALAAHVARFEGELGEDDRRRLAENPLRLFDSKDPATRRALSGAPTPLEFLDEGSRAHYGELKALLTAAGIPFVESPDLVRGLDYYTKTVFEVTSARLGAQDAILGGGRYDHLVGDLGGASVPAVGFAIGEDRLVESLESDPRPALPVFLVLPGSTAEAAYALRVASEIRRARPEAVVETDLSGRAHAFKRGLARAASLAQGDEPFAFCAGAVYAVLLGEDERAAGTVTLKNLASREQSTFPLAQLPARLEAAP